MAADRALTSLLTGSVAAVAAQAGRRGLGSALDGPRWVRTNFRGEHVSLLEGPAVGSAVVVGSLLAGGRGGAAAALAGAGGLAFGLIDDLAEDSVGARKGLRGHLGAMAKGELTTGGLKVVGIGATSLLAAAIAAPPRRSWGWVAEVAVGGALVASSANLVNLLDLRPGRALKACAVGALPTLAGPGAPVGAAVLGAVGASLPGDLDERDMLGDSGANALGAVLGVAALHGTSMRVRALLLAGTVGLTLASERFSFSAVIDRTPGLRELDAWGRR